MRKRLLALVALCALGAGCIYPYHGHRGHGPHYRAVKHHVHGHACGHVYVGGAWVIR